MSPASDLDDCFVSWLFQLAFGHGALSLNKSVKTVDFTRGHLNLNPVRLSVQFWDNSRVEQGASNHSRSRTTTDSFSIPSYISHIPIMDISQDMWLLTFEATVEIGVCLNERFLQVDMHYTMVFCKLCCLSLLEPIPKNLGLLWNPFLFQEVIRVYGGEDVNYGQLLLSGRPS